MIWLTVFGVVLAGIAIASVIGRWLETRAAEFERYPWDDDR